MDSIDNQILNILSDKIWHKRASIRKSLTANITDRDLRHRVELLIKENSYAVSSSERGYKLITTEREYKEAEIYFKKKIYSMFNRINKLREALNKLPLELQFK